MDKEQEKKNKKINKSVVIGIVVLAVGVGTAFYIGKQQGRNLPATSRHYSNNKVLATVGDVKITEKDLKSRMEPLFYMNGKNKMPDEQIDAYEEKMVDYLTTTEMLYQEGIKNKVKVDQKTIDEQYTSLMATIAQTFGIDEANYLKEFNLTKEEVKKSIEKEAIAEKYIQKESQVSDKEVEDYYNKHKKDLGEVKASHILIKNVDENGKKLDDAKIKENKKLAENVLKKALEGENFEDLAKKYSEDTSAENGGDLGFFGKGAMVEEFEKAAFSLNKGEIYPEIVETQYGYHIIKKTDEKEKSLEEVKESLKEQLVVEKQDALIQKLTKEYKTEIKK